MYQRLVETIKSNMDEKMLKELCLYRWGGISIDDVTDERILRESESIVSKTTHSLMSIDYLVESFAST